MSLENKRSSLVNFNDSGRRGGRDLSRFGTVYKSPNSISDIEKTSTPVDDGSKSRINKTIPVHMIPQPEPVKEQVKEEKILVEEPVKKEEVVEKSPVLETKSNIFTSGSKSTAKF